MTPHRLAARVTSLLASACGAALDPAERAVVLGDLAESKASPVRALGDIAGLAARRQLALWSAPGPWAALLTMALPLGVLLSHVTRAWSDGSAIYLNLYIERFTWTYAANPGSRQEMLSLALAFIVNAAALWAWSWTAGFTSATLSRRTLWLTGGLFALALFGGTLGTITAARAPLPSSAHGLLGTHFYGVVLPRLFRAGLVLLPFVLGARAARRPASPGIRLTIPAAIAAVVLTAWSAPAVEGSVTHGRNVAWAGPGPDGFYGSDDDPHPLALRLIPVGLAWPTIVMVATTLRRSHRNASI